MSPSLLNFSDCLKKMRLTIKWSFWRIWKTILITANIWTFLMTATLLSAQIQIHAICIKWTFILFYIYYLGDLGNFFYPNQLISSLIVKRVQVGTLWLVPTDSGHRVALVPPSYRPQETSTNLGAANSSSCQFSVTQVSEQTDLWFLLRLMANYDEI